MDIDVKADLERLFRDFKWKFRGIIDEDGKLYEIPKIPQVITGIFEMVAQQKIEEFAKTHYECEVVHGGPREYPNLMLKGGKLKQKILAIEVKTTRRDEKNPKKCSRMSLGSYAGYFRFPDKKMPGCIIPYGQFSEHWIVGFIYSWHPELDSLHMVSDIEVIVQQKWKIASKHTATGDTAAIGSIDDVERLKKGEGEFKSEAEFENYWRSREVRRGK